MTQELNHADAARIAQEYRKGKLPITPGRWDQVRHFASENELDYVPTDQGLYEVVAANESINEACHLGEFQDAVEEAEANSSAIGALPALLAQHAAMVEALEGLRWRFDDDDSNPHAPEETAPDILAMRTALALATTEEAGDPDCTCGAVNCPTCSGTREVQFSYSEKGGPVMEPCPACAELVLLRELYDELKGCTWRREDGGENRLAVTMANMERLYATIDSTGPATTRI